MSIVVNVNGESINYPQTGDTNWGDEATDFAVQASSALAKIGLSTGTTVDLPGTLDVTGNTTLDSNLAVVGDVAINTNKFNITASSGNTTIAGTLGISNGTASAPSLSPSGNTNTGLYSIGTNKLGFSANGTRVGEFGVGYGGFTGNIIQVVSTTKTDTSTFSTTFGTISGLSQSITPKYSNSKILILINISIGRSADNVLYFKMLRGSTDIYIGDLAGSRTLASSMNYMSTSSPGLQSSSITLIFLDSPATTSLTTYNTQARCDSGSGFINRTGTDTDSAIFSRNASSITLMEVQQ